MEPTTNEWIAAFQELNRRPELHQLVVHRQGVWSFIAERPNNKMVATTYYKSKVYKTETFYW
jgi:hypothetical protein